MNDDNPLWYDHTEPAERPGPILLFLAAAFTATAGILALAKWVLWLPDRIWNALSGVAERAIRKGCPVRR